MKYLELLAPAGSPEALRAAVQGGADAVYLGIEEMNARRGAKNFSLDQLAQAVEYCHLRGVKVYLTMNTLLNDRELPQALTLGREAQRLGIDAALVQDLGVAKLLRESCPDLPLHASTQMTVCDLAGIQACADLGLSRVVLARELPREELETLCAQSPLPLEVFVHGALCQCYSGQCAFSAVVGERSGNRGLCAQPCRLPYQQAGQTGYPLSLKDLCLIDQLPQLRDMGIASLKLEGRMKRPEYVYWITKIYADVLREDRAPTQQERQILTDVFSRGFTQDYYLDRPGPQMQGTRPDNPAEPEELFAQARRAYTQEECRQVPVTLAAIAAPERPLTVTAKDADGHQVVAMGSQPEPAQTRATSAAQLEAQLRKTGGTIYTPAAIHVNASPGLSIPLSAINALRREALTALDLARTTPTHWNECPDYTIPHASSLAVDAPRFSAFAHRLDQLSPALLEGCGLVYLPCQEIAAHQDAAAQLVRDWPQVQFAAALPQIVWQREQPQLRAQLEAAKAAGISQALLTHIGQLALVRELELIPRGEHSLGLFNSLSAQVLADMGLRSAAGSIEARLEQLRDLEKPLELELLAYGRLPLMTTQQPLFRDGPALEDRKGEVFPLAEHWGGRTQLYNSHVLWWADRLEELSGTGAAWLRLQFLEESPEDCAKVLRAYQAGEAPPEGFTRGLYRRGVR